jgi:hypothetical protein
MNAGGMQFPSYEQSRIIGSPTNKKAGRDRSDPFSPRYVSCHRKLPTSSWRVLPGDMS